MHLFLYDNEKPLSYQDYHFSEKEKKLADEAVHAASEKYNVDIFSAGLHKIITQTEFGFTSSSGQDYYASASMVPREHGKISFLILFSLERQENGIANLRRIICLAACTAMVLLLIFSWYFTKRIIIPLENSQKQQILFIASASHELRSPLAVLRSGLEVLKTTANTEEQLHFIDLMTEESSRMQNLMNQMLLLANSDSGHLPVHMESCQPDGILLNIYEKYEPLALKKKISLSIALPEEILPDCCLDSERITQVFTILMDNALSYTPSGGKIALSLTFCKPASLLFCFSDTGCGVPDEEKKRIFDRFYRSEKAHTDKEHFGLGLCIAKEIVSAHKGSIWAEDSDGTGSRFFVRLPIKTG